MTKKTKLRISQIFGIAFLIFWQAETWYFIIRDGWHWGSITEAEKTCDVISSTLLIISSIFFSQYFTILLNYSLMQISVQFL